MAGWRTLLLCSVIWSVPMCGWADLIELRLRATVPSDSGGSGVIRISTVFDSDVARTQPGTGELALFDPLSVRLALPDGRLTTDALVGSVGIGNDFTGEFPPGDTILLDLRFRPNPLDVQFSFAFAVSDPTGGTFDTVDPLEIGDDAIAALIAAGNVSIQTASVSARPRVFTGDQVRIRELSFRRVEVPEVASLALLLLSLPALRARLRAGSAG